MQKKKLLGEQSGKLNALSPLNTLSRGYAIPVKEDGTVIRSVGDTKKGDEFTLKLKDGDTKAMVI